MNFCCFSLFFLWTFWVASSQGSVQLNIQDIKLRQLGFLLSHRSMSTPRRNFFHTGWPETTRCQLGIFINGNWIFFIRIINYFLSKLSKTHLDSLNMPNRHQLEYIHHVRNTSSTHGLGVPAVPLRRTTAWCEGLYWPIPGGAGGAVMHPCVVRL